jgi:hypothetical protein
VIAGGNSRFMRAAAQALADLLPNARADILEGQRRDIEPGVLGPVLTEFLKEGNDQSAGLEGDAIDQIEREARA